jgi:signal transduction histidine kinase
MQQRLLQTPRLQLTMLYAGVIGGILFIIGIVSHVTLQRAFNRIVDRELHLLSNVLNSKLENILKEPGKLPTQANQTIPELCFARQRCLFNNKNSTLYQLTQAGYHLQLLDLQGQPLAAIIESPNHFPANPQLIASQTIQDQTGELFHLHLMPLRTTRGELWGYLQVGKSIQRLDEYMENLHWLLLLGIPSTILLIGGVGWVLAGLAIQPLYQSYERMQQFTADVTHELKTPLATVQAVIETALADPNATALENQQNLKSLHRQTQRLNQLVQDLLLLTQLDYQSTTVNMNQRICLNELIEDLVEELAGLAIAAKVDLSYEMHVSSLISIKGNSNQFYRLVSNLISNAIKYTSEHGKVTVVLQKTANCIMIHIHDTGIGISKTDIPYLFNRFYRVQPDRSRTTGGAGLGLAIVNAIAQAHGATVQVKSQLGEGSTFTVSLPLKSSSVRFGV